jgi:hypothetical protein
VEATSISNKIGTARAVPLSKTVALCAMNPGLRIETWGTHC